MSWGPLDPRGPLKSEDQDWRHRGSKEAASDGPLDGLHSLKANKKMSGVVVVQATLFCLCQQPYYEDTVMVRCDGCDDWLHLKCVGLSNAAAKTLRKYTCPLCASLKVYHLPSSPFRSYSAGPFAEVCFLGALVKRLNKR